MSIKRPMVVIKQMSVSAHFWLLYKKKNRKKSIIYILCVKKSVEKRSFTIGILYIEGENDDFFVDNFHIYFVVVEKLHI